MIPLTSWRMGMIRFLLGSMCSAFAASCVEQRGAPTKVQNRSSFAIGTNGWNGARTSTVLTMELRTVGRPLLPTRTSASASRFWNRTSIVGMSIPTLQESNTLARAEIVRHPASGP